MCLVSTVPLLAAGALQEPGTEAAGPGGFKGHVFFVFFSFGKC